MKEETSWYAFAQLGTSVKIVGLLKGGRHNIFHLYGKRISVTCANQAGRVRMDSVGKFQKTMNDLECGY